MTTPDADATDSIVRQFFAQLNSTLATRDTPRGLVVTVTDSMFEPGDDRLRPDARQPIANMAAILASHPGLARARGRLRRIGGAFRRTCAGGANGAHRERRSVPARVGSDGIRQLAAHRPERHGAGREQNRRVEVMIYGNSIGNKALWDHPYSLRSQR